jgi:hypothetical protein
MSLVVVATFIMILALIVILALVDLGFAILMSFFMVPTFVVFTTFIVILAFVGSAFAFVFCEGLLCAKKSAAYDCDHGKEERSFDPATSFRFHNRLFGVY